LLDEIGGGTDPSEGAAIATAVLQYLSSEVSLTVATTHSAELKTLKDQNSTFENASVEFDIVTLRPTYKVLWGLAGQSNALDIATSFGFDQIILTRARGLVKTLRPSRLGARTAEVLVPLIKQRAEMLKRSIDAAEVLSKARGLHQEVSSSCSQRI
jgi:DNA mismatch repair protein MutS2